MPEKVEKAFRHRINTSITTKGLVTWDATVEGTGFTRDVVPRLDRQDGICCTLFRNEGSILSTLLVTEADDLAWVRWPDVERHFTYVAPAQVQSVNAGYCFKKAGWSTCGMNKGGDLRILERIRPKRA